MHFEFQMLFILVFIGIFVRKLDWRRWFGVGLFLVAWMTYNIMKH